jgi:hypothetical protein
MRRFVAAVVMVAALVVAVPAEAHTRSFSTTIKRNSLATTGDDVEKIGCFIKSSRAKCLPNRRVIVTYDNGEFYGEDITDANGVWVVDDNGPTGERYVYRVTRRRISTHRHICEGDAFAEVIF